jgi:hypothetical protein
MKTGYNADINTEICEMSLFRQLLLFPCPKISILIQHYSKTVENVNQFHINKKKKLTHMQYITK